MKITDENREQMTEIIKNKAIKTVFQPIVSLKNGSVFGYEAFSRITLKKCSFSISEAFDIAREMKCLWDFELLCRKSSVKSAADKPQNAKLFLNLNPDIIRCRDFRSGITVEKLEKNDLDYGDIVFEAAEGCALRDMELFKSALNNYREQGYGVAVSNVCSGYSGINRILEVDPQYIKIDAGMVRDIERDEMKRSFVSALSQFARDIGIPVIAQGVERYEELKTLIELKINYAQGYYLAKPNEKFEKLSQGVRKQIINLSNELNKARFTPSYLSTVKELCSKKPMLSPNAMLTEVYEIMNDPNVTETAIVDDNGKFMGVLTKRQVLSALSGMYGYNLNMRKSVGEVMDTSCLTVTIDTPVETASKMAMARCQPYIYDSLPVVDGFTQEYCGFVSIKDLLLTSVNIQVKRAADCNPLTGLPGNIVIDQKVENLIGNSQPFAIIYFDLDNFKAYNDAYGFTNGDLMIKAVADTLVEFCGDGDFCGHIGGDDFVVITSGDRTESFCRDAFSQFTRKTRELYSEDDRNRGYIVSKNRSGFVEEFPLATLSAAAITNRERSYDSIKELSLVIAHTKKLAKQSVGNSLVIV
ncbi:MAG: GGDEF domain-containing protein [Oscillospiraceae bacterium]